jgi:hypothetical protein
MGARTTSVVHVRGNGPRQAGAAAPAPERANVFTKAGRLYREVKTWVRAGAPRVDRDTRKARKAECDVCPYYVAGGNLGLGECQAPGCGCTRVKLALATSKCPLGKWAAVAVQPR